MSDDTTIDSPGRPDRPSDRPPDRPSDDAADELATATAGDQPDDVDDATTEAQRDTHAWRTTLLVWAAVTVFSVVWMFVIGNGIAAYMNGKTPLDGYWMVPGDLWPPVFAGKVILYGGGLTPYTLNPNFIAMPLAGVVMLPVSILVEVFQIPRPVISASMYSYLLNATTTAAQTGAGSVPGGALPGASVMPGSPFAPIAAAYVLLWAIPFLKTVRSLAFALGARRRLWALQLSAFFLCWFPAVVSFGHLEDGLVATLLLYGVVLTIRREWLQLAIVLSIALGLKQTAALAVPLFFFFVPKGHRLRFALVTVALPVLLLVAVVTADAASAARSLLDPPTYQFVGGGRTALFINSSELVLRAGPLRYGAPVLVLVCAIWLRRNRSVPLLVAGIAVVAAARLPFESVLHMYYSSVFLLFAAVYELRRRGTVVFASGFGIPSLWLFWVAVIPAWLFWPLWVGLSAAATWPVWVDVARRRFGGPAENDLTIAEAGVGGAPSTTDGSSRPEETHDRDDDAAPDPTPVPQARSGVDSDPPGRTSESTR